MTTVKDFGALADSWAAYHLAIGFSHLFIYFDDADELAAVDLGARFPAERVTCMAHDQSLRAAWKRMPRNAAALVPHSTKEVQTRQQLNARHAVGLAVRRGDLEWLLHIDGDELFDPGPGGSAAAHFAGLSAARVATFCYANWEAVPEAHGIVDPFREVTLFKRCLEAVEPTAEARAAVDFWQARQEGAFFYYYDNGKAAVRVHPDAVPLSVHEWLPGTEEGMRHWYSNLRECWVGRGQLGGIVQHRPSDARILHYPCYHDDSLWVRWRRGNDNYRLRGREEPPPLHARVCAAAQAAHARGGDEAARRTVRRCFEDFVLLADPHEAERQQRAGVCERIRAPARLLGACR